MTFAEKIKQLRKENNLTCKELAKKAGVSKVTIHNLENGKTKPQVVVVNKLSEALGCEFKELFELL